MMEASPPAVSEMPEPNWQRLALRAGRVFRPNTPVMLRDVFAGRDAQITRVCDVIVQAGQHAVLFGERGVGKTSLANVLSQFLVATDDEAEAGPIISPRVNCDAEDTFDSVWRKVFSDVRYPGPGEGIGFGGDGQHSLLSASDLLSTEAATPDSIRRALTAIGNQSIPILIIDEFDRLGESARRAFADLIKMLSDYSVPATVVLVGVADSIDGLLKDHESVSRAIVQVQMPRMNASEIQQVLISGVDTLGMSIESDATARIVRISQGLPHYAHLLGLHSVRSALAGRSLRISLSHVSTAIGRAIDDAQQSIRSAYYEGIRSARKDSLFADVLLACSLAQCDELGYFAAQDVRAPMRSITGRNYDIPNFAQHLHEFAEAKRGCILVKTGFKRRYRYRFRDPLMQPFVIMQGALSERLPSDF